MDLPPHWKVAKDPTGKPYYYHAITRKTQWEKPTSQDEGVITMDLATPTPEPTPERSSGEEEVEQEAAQEVVEDDSQEETQVL